MSNTKLDVINQGSTVILSRKCPFCGKEIHKEMPTKEFYDGVQMLKQGALIQNAFPNADASTREFIHTGICDKCWDNL